MSHLPIVPSAAPAAASAAPGICPICAGDTRRYCEKHAHGRAWHIERCLVCGHGFVSDRPTFEQLSEIYARDESHLRWDPQTMTVELYERRPDCRSLARAIVSLSRERGPLLDVGCGDGGFSYHLAKQGYTPTLIDLDPRAAEVSKWIKQSTFRLCSFEEFSDDFARQSPPPQKFAAIVMSQVLEHALDPMDWLRRASGALSEDGVLAVAVPNFGGVYKLLGKRDPFIDPPIHLNFFTPRSMRLAFERAGLTVVRMNSLSRLELARRRGMRGLVRRVVQTAWNSGAWVLNATSRGVILRSYGKPAPAPR